MAGIRKKRQPKAIDPPKSGDHPAKGKGITGLTFVRDFGHGRWGTDPRRQVQLLMMLAIPDNIELPNLEQIVVTGELALDSTYRPVVQLHLHTKLIVDTLKPTEDELEFDQGDYKKMQRKYIQNDSMRLDQILTTLGWMV